MSLPLRPWFQWGWPGEESEYAFDLPMMPWTPARGGVGGSATAASGIPEAYSIRRDRIVRLKLRVYEHELVPLEAFLDWAQDSGEPFLFRFDTDDAATEFSVYLQAPRWEDGQEFDYPRDDEFPNAFIIPIALRTELGGPFDVTWTELATETEPES